MWESSDEKVKDMNKTTFEKGMEKGIQALQNTLVMQGKMRFGQVPDELESRIRSISEINRLESLLGRILVVQSWDELLKNG